jgi:hypothetical protein
MDWVMKMVKEMQKGSNASSSYGPKDMLELMRSPHEMLRGQIITDKISLCMDILKEFALAAMTWTEKVVQPPL